MVWLTFERVRLLHICHLAHERIQHCLTYERILAHERIQHRLAYERILRLAHERIHRLISEGTCVYMLDIGTTGYKHIEQMLSNVLYVSSSTHLVKYFEM